MVDRALAAIGVDPGQWRALVRTALRVDMRTGGAILTSHARRRAGGSGAGTFVGLLASFALMGAFMAAMLVVLPNTFFAATLLFTYVIFSVGSSLLLEFHSIVLSPDDYRQLGYQPVSSRTFFAARLTSVLVYVWAMTMALGLCPIVVALFTSWGGPLASLIIAVGLFSASTLTAFWAIGLYVVLLRVVSATRLRRTLSYLQLVMTFTLYGSYFLVPRMIGEGAFIDRTFPADGWILLAPGAWFASYLQIVLGLAQPAHVALAALTGVLLIGGVWLTAGRVSLDYADRLSVLLTTPSGTSGGPGRASSSSSRARRLGPGRWFRDGERRALALVVGGLFRHDMKFRLGVLGILPLTVIYLFGGTRSHGVIDPFLQDVPMEPQLYYFAVLLFPSMLKQALSRSDAYRASWIFYSSPVEPARLVFALNEFVVAYFLLPYLLLVGVVLAFFFTNWAHLAILLITLALLTNLNLLVEVCLAPQLPFTQPATRGSHARNVVVMIIVITTAGMLLPWLLHLAFVTPLRVTVTLAALALLNVGLALAARRRVHRHVAVAEIAF